jgi:hypothetical protein
MGGSKNPENPEILKKDPFVVAVSRSQGLMGFCPRPSDRQFATRPESPNPSLRL